LANIYAATITGTGIENAFRTFEMMFAFVSYTWFLQSNV